MMLAVALGVCGGCAAIQTPTTQISRAPQESIVVVYRVTDARPLRAATQDSTNTTPRTCVLSLKYPHPKCKPGYARVELIVESSHEAGGAGNTPSRLASTVESFLPGVRMAEGIDEAWTIDVRKEDVHQAITDVERQGFFTAAVPAQESMAVLLVERGGTKMAREWSTIPSLDKLVRRARTQGALVSHLEAPIDVAELLPRQATPPAAVVQQASLPTIERLPPIVR